jgi:hypothetical protein
MRLYSTYGLRGDDAKQVEKREGFGIKYFKYIQ